MKTPGIYIGAFAVCCIVALVIGTASAAAMTQQGSCNNFRDTARLFGPQKMIERLEQQGVDVTEVKTALQNGDTTAVKEWLQAYREAHPDLFPARGEGARKGPMNGDAKGERMTGMLDNLTAQGYDVSAIISAVMSGNFETAHTLIQEFRTAHPDLFPARGEGAGKGPMNGKPDGERMTGMLENLTAQGYDVSAISSAVTSGNYETAHTLMQEFRTAHPDLFPARGEEAGSGHPGGQMGQRRTQR
jgi:hypothetical protein